MDAAGTRSPSPFPAAGFGGATGVIVRQRAGSQVTLLVGRQASGWATFYATPDPGTAGTAYGYSISTAGVLVNGRPLLIDVFSGAQTLSK